MTETRSEQYDKCGRWQHLRYGASALREAQTSLAGHQPASANYGLYNTECCLQDATEHHVHISLIMQLPLIMFSSLCNYAQSPLVLSLLLSLEFSLLLPVAPL